MGNETISFASISFFFNSRAEVVVVGRFHPALSPITDLDLYGGRKIKSNEQHTHTHTHTHTKVFPGATTDTSDGWDKRGKVSERP